MLISTAFFYLFAAVLTVSALMVITARNPVHAVLFLILSFFNAAGLFVLIGAEYLAMTLVIVYVGAVAVLFLFVVMMLNVNFAELRAGMLRYLPVGLAVAAVLFAELIILIGTSFDAGLTGALYMPVDAVTGGEPVEGDVVSNTRAIGQVLYTQYVLAFQLAGLILLVAMIGAIVLTLRQRPGVRRQRVADQLARRREESVEIVHVEPAEAR